MHPRDATAYEASRRTPRSFAHVDERRVAYVRLGQGAPAAVFLSGAGMDIDAWFKVLPEVATFTTALAWDRPGVGRSEPPTVPQTGEVIVATLRDVLQQAGIRPPLVLVGHSLGGLHAELFARRHPDEVTAVVLVEGAGPEEAADPPSGGPVARLLGAAGGALDRLRGRSRGLAEVDVVADSVRQLGGSPAFPAVPLIVVSGGRRMRFVPPAAFEAHQAAQRARVALSPLGRQVIAERSGHFPNLTEPGVVIGAIRDAVTALSPD